MKRTLRGLWSRRGTLLPLLLLTVVVVAGTVTVVGFADRAGTSAMLGVPLLILGLVAVPATGRELATARRGEIALARLRGLQGLQLYRLLAGEPFLVLLLGGLVGLVLGAVGSLLATAAWAGAGAALPGAGAVLAGAAIVVVGLAAVLLGMAGALREPLSGQVSTATRPRSATVGALFFDVLVVVAAVVAVYRSSVAGGDPDWVVLAGPALVGLAIGMLVVWLVRAGARVAVRRTASGSRSLSGFLAVRRLARVADAATALRVLVAATVVAAVAVTGAAQVGAWSEDTARLRTGAPLRVPLDAKSAGGADAPAALKLAHDLDPDGRWLMAAVLVPGEGSVVARRAFLDTARFDAVLGDFYAGTPGAISAGDLAGLTGTEGLAAGDTLRVTVRGVSARHTGTMRPQVRVAYRDSEGKDRKVTARLHVDRSGAADTVSTPLEGCATGCVVTAVTLARSPGDSTLPWVLTGLELGGSDLVHAKWRTSAPNWFGEPTSPTVVDDGLLAGSTFKPLTAQAEETAPSVPVLATDSATWEGKPLLDSPGGDERHTSVVDRLPALPLVEADGLLADLPRAAAGAPPTVPAAEVMVLARADTPASVLDRLVARAGHRPVALDTVRQQVTDETGAAQAKVYALMALFCVLAALLVLATAVARQRTAWTREVAALRAVGVSGPVLRASGRVEALWLTGAATAATVLGALLAVPLLLSHLPLVTVPEHAEPLHSGLAWWPLALGAVVAAVITGLVAGRGRMLRPEQSRPAILREEGAA
jgi:hypothetical protein